MIKLNNKKITYVALADSNNSVKGVKEIWYADSANSVKLVYRRKDALIEGEDYEKYHWLEGRNGAYINTEHFAKTYEDAFEVYAKYDGTTVNPDGGEQNLFGIQGNIKLASYIDNNNNINAIIKQSDGSNYNINIHKEVFKIALYAPNQSEYIKALDDASYTNPIIGTVTNDTNLKMYVFARNGKVNSYFHGDISYFHITDTTFTIDKLHLIPCKLLKPVPKWLDANGIRRQVGECGMIDLISGKFYGNVNSVGTFTVENYYERKEWLIGDGSAYIDTGHNVNEDLDYETKAYLLPNTYLFWYRSGKPFNDQTMVVRVDTSITKNVRVAKNSTYVRIGDTANVEVQWNNNEFLANGVNYIPSSRAITFNYELYLFYAYLADSALTEYSSNNVKCSYFRFLDSNRNYIQNLIPCTLTMDLPASMDANGIARTKGTSGMWDLVSDRFYGNVANSGTFKAVNLAEGVDYEVHQWLKAICPINTTMMTLSIGSQNFNWKVKIEQLGNINYIRSDGYSYFTATNTAKIVHIWDIPNEVTIFSAQTARTEGMIVNISSTSDSLTFNGEIIPKYGFQNIEYRISNNINGVRDAITYISSITIDGIERYIPVKLLRSIPAKYDANGIARNAGECGMYDTVNDVFYGNVANSGTFTVSDDE